MALNVQDQLSIVDSSIRDKMIKITCQTLLYGIYLCLVPIVVRVMVTNGLQSRSRKWFLAFITSMFALSTIYWISSIVLTFRHVDLLNNSIKACYNDSAPLCLLLELSAVRVPPAALLTMLDSILLVNYIIADGVIVWRAWVLCSDQRRVVLMIPVLMLGINTVIYLMTIVSRVIEVFFPGKPQRMFFLLDLMNITQVAHLAFSLSINIYATSIIALKAWKYSRLLMESGIGIRTPTQAIKILALLIESGVIYILIGVMSLVSITILDRLGLAGISEVFLPVGIQLVGVYPIVVVLLVEMSRSPSSAYSSFGSFIAGDARGGLPSHTEPMSFAPGPKISSGGQIDLATKAPNTDIYVTFDSRVEPGGAGMGARSSKDSYSSEEHAAS